MWGVGCVVCAKGCRCCLLYSVCFVRKNQWGINKVSHHVPHSPLRLMAAPWVVSQQGVLVHLLDTIDLCRPPAAKASSMQQQLGLDAEAGQAVLAQLMTLLGHFPSSIGPQNVSSLITEEIELEDIAVRAGGPEGSRGEVGCAGCECVCEMFEREMDQRNGYGV